MPRSLGLLRSSALLLLVVVACSSGPGIDAAPPSPSPQSSAPTSTVLPTITATPSPTPTATPRPTFTPIPTPTPTPSPSPTPTPTSTPTRVPTIAISAGVQARNVVRGDAARPLVALTFDAGSGADGAETILDALREHGVRSTFFLTGAWVKRYPEMARRIAVEGHELANHSFSHPDFTQISDDRIRSEIASTEELIREETGLETKPLFRFPFGAYDARVLRALRAAGYLSIYWTLDSSDWREETTAPDIGERVLRGAGNGFIVVHHVSPKKTGEALRQIIPGLKARGFSLVTVSELLAN